MTTFKKFITDYFLSEDVIMTTEQVDLTIKHMIDNFINAEHGGTCVGDTTSACAICAFTKLVSEFNGVSTPPKPEPVEVPTDKLLELKLTKFGDFLLNNYHIPPIGVKHWIKDRKGFTTRALVLKFLKQ